MPDAAVLNLVPRPVSATVTDGRYELPANLAIAGPTSWAAIARRLLSPGTGLDLPVDPAGDFTINRVTSLAPEAYRLAVAPTGITIEASDERGVNWAVQTIRQLLPDDALRAGPGSAPLELPIVQIEDAPRFGWRGVMLDVARHFFPLRELYSFIDLLALHKFNTFHLHLTEDQGWRFESKKYPKLQEISSWRTETRRPHSEVNDHTPHGGFYTQDQLRSLVAYAEQRGITIVPEIEFPGHLVAVLAAYPELSNDPSKDYAAATTFGVFSEVLNMTDDAMQFVFDIYTELLEIFPSRYVHVGGDECPRDEWLASPAAQELAKQRGLSDAGQLQNWFTRQLRDWLAERGRQLVGWDEINDEGPLEGAVTMAWRGMKPGIVAAEAGLDVVMAPNSHLYFDYYPSVDPAEPYSIGGGITTEQVYGFDPLAGISEDAQSRVIGTQAQIWTEYMPTMRRVEYMLYPRACAHSEVAWSAAERRSWAEFEPRLEAHLERLDALGVNFRPETGPKPWQQGGTGVGKRTN